MDKHRKAAETPQGVSIICCTNRERFLPNLVRNYKSQLHPRKELIIVVNADRINLIPYIELARKNKNIQVYPLPGRYSLGACLNFAVGRARYPYVAKFDDDDYYAPYYLTESLQTLRKKKADVIGKRAHYMFLQGSRTLLLRFPNEEHKAVSLLPGATLLFRRKVFDQVRFPDRSVGEDDEFCRRCAKKGYSVYSAGRFNFVALRRKNSAGHTWKISDKTLIAYHKTVKNVRDYKRYVQKKPKDAGP